MRIVAKAKKNDLRLSPFSFFLVFAVAFFVVADCVVLRAAGFASNFASAFTTPLVVVLLAALVVGLVVGLVVALAAVLGLLFTSATDVFARPGFVGVAGVTIPFGNTGSLSSALLTACLN